MNLMEGAPLAERRRIHLESCARCADTLKSVEAVRNQVTEMQMADDDHIPEPDWTEFRGDVRNALLSRSVKRQGRNRSWIGSLGLNPAAAWGFSMLLVLGLTASIVIWNQDTMEPNFSMVVPIEEPLEAAGTINAIASMGQTDVFDDLIQLDVREAATLQSMLEDLTRKSVAPQ